MEKQRRPQREKIEEDGEEALTQAGTEATHTQTAREIQKQGVMVPGAADVTWVMSPIRFKLKLRSSNKSAGNISCQIYMTKQL